MVNFNDNMPEDLRRKLESDLDSTPGANIESINILLRAQTEEYNRTPQAELQGYSPAMCHALRHEWNTPGSPIQFNVDLKLEDLNQAKTFRRIRGMLLAVHAAGEVKATPKGNFNRRFVASMMDTLLTEDEKEVILRYHKSVNEEDFFSLHEARIIAKITNLLVTEKGRIRVAKKHTALLEPKNAGRLFVMLFTTYFGKYNIGYRFKYGVDVDWLQRAIDFLLYPLSLKAQRWLDVNDLAPELLHPMTLERLQHELSGQKFFDECKAVERYFVRPLYQWGLLEVEWENQGRFRLPLRIRVNQLFQQFIQFDTAAE